MSQIGALTPEQQGPLASILIPCYNAAPYIGAAIESALGQTYRPIEVIVLDDGSTDGSCEVLRRFDALPNFRWESGPNRGGNATRNRLLQMATGEIVQWLDADDVLDPSKLSQQVAMLQQGYDMVFCNMRLADEHLALTRSLIANPPIGSDLLTYFLMNSVGTLAPIHRVEDLIAVGGFDEKLDCCQEYEFHIRLAEQAWTTVAFIDQPLCTARSVPASVSSNDRKVFGRKAEIVASLCERLRNRDQLTNERAHACAHVLYNCGRHLVREGDVANGRRAFNQALTLAPPAEMPVSPAMRMLTRFTGPVRAERFRSMVLRGLR